MEKMRKTLIAAGIFLVVVGIAALEYVFFPDRVDPLQASITKSSDQNSSVDGNTVRFDVPVSQISEKSFELAGLPGIMKEESAPSSHLFGVITLKEEEDGMVAVKSDFYDGDILLVRAYEMYPLHNTTAAKAFQYIKVKLEKSFRNDPETTLNQTDEYGTFSLYFNPSSSKDKAYLLVVAPEKLIGFEYLKENHKKLLPLFNHLVPSIKDSAPSDGESSGI